MRWSKLLLTSVLTIVLGLAACTAPTTSGEPAVATPAAIAATETPVTATEVASPAEAAGAASRTDRNPRRRNRNRTH